MSNGIRSKLTIAHATATQRTRHLSTDVGVRNTMVGGWGTGRCVPGYLGNTCLLSRQCRVVHSRQGTRWLRIEKSRQDALNIRGTPPRMLRKSATAILTTFHGKHTLLHLMHIRTSRLVGWFLPESAVRHRWSYSDAMTVPLPRAWCLSLWADSYISSNIGRLAYGVVFDLWAPTTLGTASFRTFGGYDLIDTQASRWAAL